MGRVERAEAPVTLAQLVARFGRAWTICEAVGGGWYAVRRAGISVYGHHHGLSDVRCGASLAELARHLEAEKRLEGQTWQRVPTRPAL
ncbi:hypothetical protein GCM10010517_71950 [Streptosporangium fragile]|uniref:Uncharacterized protein n=1 Tax=Streptosporangium fragile TaxID=46186 RepID=A0ABN3W8V7_9ACTN